jgi:3-deoxy-manno-octulosonate cytidylyltransferase (CMP-KDO synthetase)
MIVGIIPARYASTRFPGKPLIDIQGTTMIQRVYERAKKSTALNKIVVATDDERIREHVVSFGGDVVMTASNHPSGTDRCWEALQQMGSGYDYVINIQGDEPFIDPAQINALASVLQNGAVEIATLMIPVESPIILFDPGEAKIVVNEKMEALYFSRGVIPYFKGIDPAEWHRHHQYFRHVGMYAYRSDILGQITKLGVSSLERAESLEQLRWIQHGFTIQCAITRIESHCIDTPDDIAKVLRLLQKS